MVKKMTLLKIYHKLIFGSVATPIPGVVCLNVFLMNLFESLIITNILPFLPHLVKALGVSEVDVAKKAAVITLSLFISRIFSSLIWGYICDKCGIKLSIIWSIVGLIVSTLIFGFSSSITWCLLSRFLQGLFMDNTNQAAGLTLIFSGRSIGLIVGSSLGGFLAFPVQNYPHIFTKGSVFDLFKVFLPSIVIAAGLGIQLFLAIWLLPSDLCLLQMLKLNDQSSKCYENIEDKENTLFMNADSAQRIVSYRTCIDKILQSNFVKLLSNPDYLLSNLLCVAHAIFSVGFEDLIPVFLATSKKYNGVGMSAPDIGLLFLIIAITTILIQVMSFNKLYNKFGAKKIFIWSSLMFSLLTIFLPLCGIIERKVSLWFALWISQTIIRLCNTAGFLSVNIFINNSVESDVVGLANGLSSSMVSIGRTIGVAIFGNIYSWSMGNVHKKITTNDGLGFPFNQYWAFIIISIVCLACVIICFCIPVRLNKK
ncbi:uncharacterized protein LOC136091295 isoform X2 [Hydra vulgaris]|uniref:Uncharacterized protein LOC136091295 isoform X2 n=1 Tax=Hydra vulgaris TaxID=6087 RepID=A0ABM4DJP9_HYDVU